MKIKEILAAGIIQDVQFINADALSAYLYSMVYHGIEYQILEELKRDDGSIIIRIVKKYNNSPLIQLPEVSE